MVRKIEFVFGQDEATGQWGALPKQYIESEFNYFWNHQGLFHDIIEHSHEEFHKYFRGEFAYNVGGELFAMGICYSVYNNFVPHDRPFDSNRCFNESIKAECIGLLYDVDDGSSQFGDEILCNIPYQKPTEHYFEYMIYELTEKYPKYKKEVYRLLRAGFRYGERTYKRTWESEQNLHKLFDILKKLTKQNVEGLMAMYSGFEIKINNQFKFKLKMIEHELS